MALSLEYREGLLAVFCAESFSATQFLLREKDYLEHDMFVF